MSLKLAYCIPSVHIIGGMERTLSIKANHLADRYGYEITIIVTDGKCNKPAFYFSDKIEIINLDLNYDSINSYNLPKKFIAYSIKQWQFKRRLTKLLNKIKPDITISMLRRDINFITNINDGSKKIGELHLNRFNFRDFKKGGPVNKVKQILATMWMHQLLSNLKRLDKFIVLSQEDKTQWPEISNIDVIYNAIQTYPTTISGCENKRVIAAGRMENQKGFDMLIKSWAIVSKRHPDWTLDIFGGGNREPYQTLIENLSLSHSCHVHEPSTIISKEFINSSIFAFSSRFEGFGMVIPEAMSCGLPPVAFACPCGPKDIITDGVDGILVEPENIEMLANKICYLIENEYIRKQMGQMARIRSERFNIDIIAKEWDNLFRNILNK